MKVTAQEYAKLYKKASPPSTVLKDCLWAFAVGGAICALGQVLFNSYMLLVQDEKAARAWVSVTLIAAAAFLTACKIYDKLAKHAGAGTIVPITGFANSIVSPAMEFKTEGLVLGLGAKMFSIAGPVIVYGISACIAYGIVAFVFHLY